MQHVSWTQGAAGKMWPWGRGRQVGTAEAWMKSEITGLMGSPVSPQSCDGSPQPQNVVAAPGDGNHELHASELHGRR